MSKVVVVGNKAEWDDIHAKSGGKAVIIDFFADWCGPCKMIAPKFAAMSEEYTNMIFLKVNVDNLEEVAALCKISAMPTFQVWKDNAKVDEVVGANPDKLKALCDKYNAEAAA